MTTVIPQSRESKSERQQRLAEEALRIVREHPLLKVAFIFYCLQHYHFELGGENEKEI